MRRQFVPMIMICLASFACRLSAESAGGPTTRPTLTIAAEPSEGIVQEDGKGFYSELVQTIIGSDYDLKYSYVPWARAEKLFMNGKVDVLLGQSHVGFNGRHDRSKYILPENPLEIAPLFATFVKGRYKNWDDKYLKTDRLLWVNSYEFNLNLGFEPKRQKSFAKYPDGLGLLKKKRADIILDYEGALDSHLTGEFEASNFTTVRTKVNDELHFMLQNTSRHAEAKAVWDKNFSKHQKSGKIKQITEKYGYTYFGGA